VVVAGKEFVIVVVLADNDFDEIESTHHNNIPQTEYQQKRFLRRPQIGYL